LRAYVFLSVFLSGASVMSLEMAGFRLVQPEFGSDIIVWGSLISVILGGLSLGAYTGGRLADRVPAIRVLGAIVLLCGLVVTLMPWYSDGIITWLARGRELMIPASASGGSAIGRAVYEPPDIRWAVLGSGFFLFFVPALLMGMVSPYSAKLLIHTMPSVGKGVGKISAISTLGSIAGTLGTTFYLIQILGTRSLILANGILLLVIGAGAMVLGLAKTSRPEPAGVSR